MIRFVICVDVESDDLDDAYGKLLDRMNGNDWESTEMVTDGGGVEQIFSRGTKRELYDKLHAFIKGLGVGRELGHSDVWTARDGRTHAYKSGYTDGTNQADEESMESDLHPFK